MTRPILDENPKSRKHNRSNLPGAMSTGSEYGKFMSRICINGERYYLGYFYDAQSASEAYLAARRNAANGILPNGKTRNKIESQ